MKRLIKPLALALGIGLFAGTGVAVAAPPIPNDTTPFQLDCPGFQIDVQVSGSSKSKDIEFLHPSPPTQIRFFADTNAATTITMTGPAPASKVFRTAVNGTVRWAFDLKTFEIVITSTGRNLITVPKVYGTPGVFLAVGLESWTLNGPVYPNAGLTGPGTVTDVCALLAP
jgi:hypothetical protein